MDRTLQPEIHPLDHFRLIEPEKYFLSNGIPVYQFNDQNLEVVKVEFIFDAGTWFQPIPFVAFATNLMLREGTAKHSARQIAEILDFYGAHLETSTEKDKATVTLFTLQKHLVSLLPMVEEIIKQSIFPEREFNVITLKQKQSLLVNLEKVKYLAQIHFNELIFGTSHPYGYYLLPQDIDYLKREDLFEFKKKHYTSTNCTIIIAGNIQLTAQAMLAELFGGDDWDNAPVINSEFQIKPVNGQIKFVPKEDAVQSAIRIGRVLFTRSHPDYMGMQVLSTLLGGYFGSRLMTNLREDKGYTYGIGSAIIALRNSGYFFVGCEAGSGVTKLAIDEIYSELVRLCNDLVPENELDLVRNYMLGSFMRGFDGAFFMSDKYRDVLESGLDNRFYTNFIQVVRTITTLQIRELAQKYLNHNALYQLVVSNPDVLK
jgi:zinc protease